MADSDESIELLFFDTFSHDINEVNSVKSMQRFRVHFYQVKILELLTKLLHSLDFSLASQNITSNAYNDLFIALFCSGKFLILIFVFRRI